jgi:hypothetical protein
LQLLHQRAETVLVPPFVASVDLDSALAGFPAIGITITIAGALAFGPRWWPAYLLIASFVALVLLLAPDAYAAIGLIFFMLVTGLVLEVRPTGRFSAQVAVGRTSETDWLGARPTEIQCILHLFGRAPSRRFIGR